jgi:hypothetical protein
MMLKEIYHIIKQIENYENEKNNEKLYIHDMKNIKEWFFCHNIQRNKIQNPVELDFEMKLLYKNLYNFYNNLANCMIFVGNNIPWKNKNAVVKTITIKPAIEPIIDTVINNTRYKFISVNTTNITPDYETKINILTNPYQIGNTCIANNIRNVTFEINFKNEADPINQMNIIDISTTCTDYNNKLIYKYDTFEIIDIRSDDDQEKYKLFINNNDYALGEYNII